MAVSCTPADLAEAAKCFTCLDPAQREIIKTYLLAVIAGGSTDPATLLEAAKCFACLDPNQRKLINTYLLCQSANGGSGPGTCEALEGAGAPLGSETPGFIGQSYFDTETNSYWISTGLTNSDWEVVTIWSAVNQGEEQQFGLSWFAPIPGLTEITFNGTTNSAGYFMGDSNLESVYCPYLTSMDPASTYFGALNFTSATSFESLDCPMLTIIGDGGITVSDSTVLNTLNFPLLASIGSNGFVIINCDVISTISLPSLVSTGQIDVSGCPDLTSASFPSLVTVGTPFRIRTCDSLSTLTFTALVPTNGQTLDFSANALTAASVNHILARAIANAGYVTGTINTSGGTSAAPSGQGIVDKADLITRGVTVTTN